MENSQNQQPPTTQLKPQITNNTQEPPLGQSIIKYHKPGTSVLSPSIGLLEWGADQTIRVYSINPESKLITGTEFILPVNQIDKVDENSTVGLTFFMKDGNRYQCNFESHAADWLVLGGGIGLMMSQKSYADTGVYWWMQSLQDNGINVRTGMKNPAYRTGVLVAIIITIIAFIYAFSST